MSRGTKIRSIRIPDYLVEAAVKRGEEVLGTKVLSSVVRTALEEWLKHTTIDGHGWASGNDTHWDEGVTVTWDA